MQTLTLKIAFRTPENLVLNPRGPKSPCWQGWIQGEIEAIAPSDTYESNFILICSKNLGGLLPKALLQITQTLLFHLFSENTDLSRVKGLPLSQLYPGKWEGKLWFNSDQRLVCECLRKFSEY